MKKKTEQSEIDLLTEIRDELRRLNEQLTAARTTDRLNEEMDLVK